jgi:hypothetical protein
MASLPDPAKAKSLADARKQTHHAVQLATAAGISFLPKQADDSHTNLEWLPTLGALASRLVPSAAPFRIAVRIVDLELRVLDDRNATAACLALNGRRIADAEAWLLERVAERGGPAAKFTLAKHYEIPHHAVGDGSAFDTSDRGAFSELAAWFDLATEVLEPIRARDDGSEIRCWPHHFDIATLITVEEGKTVGVGLEPGDTYYDEPYFYVNANPPPQPAAGAASARLAGDGSWHTHQWFGAVLPGSRIRSSSSSRAQVDEFLDSAIAACRQFVLNGR